MIKLRVLGFSDDHGQLILSNKPRGKRGSHVVAIDKKLLQTLQDAVYGKRDAERAARGEREKTVIVPPRDEPRYPPREIQRMLRAGMSPAQVSRAVGVDVSYVEQFYAPVLYERAGVVQEAGTLYQEKPRKGLSGLPLGEAVERNLAQRRVKLDEDALRKAWSATRQEGQPWTVTLQFQWRGKLNKASWRFDPRARVLTPLNKLASDIGWMPNGKRRAEHVAQAREKANVSVDEVAKASERRRARAKAKRPTAKAGAVKRAAASRKATTARATTRKPARKATTARATARKPARKATTARKTATTRNPATARKPARKATTARKPARKTATARKPVRRR